MNQMIQTSDHREFTFLCLDNKEMKKHITLFVIQWSKVEIKPRRNCGKNGGTSLGKWHWRKKTNNVHTLRSLVCHKEGKAMKNKAKKHGYLAWGTAGKPVWLGTKWNETGEGKWKAQLPVATYSPQSAVFGYWLLFYIIFEEGEILKHGFIKLRLTSVSLFSDHDFELLIPLPMCPGYWAYGHTLPSFSVIF